MKVYLSGGMYSDWQNKMPNMKNVQYFDPRYVSQTSAINFVNDDLDAVRDSDLIFCYIEKDNPSGIGTSWECAIAKENNIPIITVWEKGYVDPFFACHSLYLYTDFNSGIEKLKKYINGVFS